MGKQKQTHKLPRLSNLRLKRLLLKKLPQKQKHHPVQKVHQLLSKSDAYVAFPGTRAAESNPEVGDALYEFGTSTADHGWRFQRNHFCFHCHKAVLNRRCASCQVRLCLDYFYIHSCTQAIE